MVFFSLVSLLILSSWLSWPLGAAPTTVTHLPWFEGPLPFHLETGYVEVDEVKGAEMFYYFTESENSPESDPLLVWHSGGPGCSALSGLVLEIGPLRFDVVAYNEDRSWLVYNPYTWTKMSNIIFVDAPMGTGFSYVNSSEGYKMSDTKSAFQTSTFIKKWLIEHPKFLTNPLYIGGDSYAGKIVPLIVEEIANSNPVGNKMFLNLKGYVVGSPKTDDLFEQGAMLSHAHGLGLISDELYEAMKQSCGGIYSFPRDADCSALVSSAFECILNLNILSILEPTCLDASPKPHNVGVNKRLLPVECISSSTLVLIDLWANEDVVREAIGIREGTVKAWGRCLFPSDNYAYDVPSSIKSHLDVTTRGYRALVYSGDHDLLIPHTSTQAWIRSLNFTILDDWRQWFVDSVVGGYTRTYSNNLTFATVKGGSHTTPDNRPKECQAMFSRWVSNAPL